MNRYSIRPAYGRDYLNKEDLLKDWNDGKDFKIIGGPYLSIRDTEALKAKGIIKLEANYDRLRMVHTITL